MSNNSPSIHHAQTALGTALAAERQLLHHLPVPSASGGGNLPVQWTGLWGLPLWPFRCMFPAPKHAWLLDKPVNKALSCQPKWAALCPSFCLLNQWKLISGTRARSVRQRQQDRELISGVRSVVKRSLKWLSHHVLTPLKYSHYKINLLTSGV